MKIAVFGSSGGMGRYFVRRFLGAGHHVTGFDLRVDANPPEGLHVCTSSREAATEADAMVIAVPTRNVPKVAREVIEAAKEGAVLVEISSIKDKVLAELKEVVKGSGATLLSVHPMFGPSSKSDTPKVLVLGGPKELRAAERLFPWAALIPVSERDHDRLMAYALNLVHVANLAFASTVTKGIGGKKFKTLSSPFGSLQLTVSEAILSEDPMLFAMIQFENPFSSEVIRSFIEESRKLLRVVEGKKEKDFLEDFASLAHEFPRKDLEEALQRAYSFFG